jgi:hypothetical protein
MSKTFAPASAFDGSHETSGAERMSSKFEASRPARAAEALSRHTRPHTRACGSEEFPSDGNRRGGEQRTSPPCLARGRDPLQRQSLTAQSPHGSLADDELATVSSAALDRPSASVTRSLPSPHRQIEPPARSGATEAGRQSPAAMQPGWWVLSTVPPCLQCLATCAVRQS